jgi:hypothetical protein
MLRNLGIALLFLGLFGAGIDGFRTRDRARTSPAANGGVAPTTTDAGGVHTSEFGVAPPQ